MNNAEKRTADIEVSLSEIIDVGGDEFFEGFLDLLIAKAWGEYAPAMNIDYEITGASNAPMVLKFKVSAELEDEDEEEDN